MTQQIKAISVEADNLMPGPHIKVEGEKHHKVAFLPLHVYHHVMYTPTDT